MFCEYWPWMQMVKFKKSSVYMLIGQNAPVLYSVQGADRKTDIKDRTYCYWLWYCLSLSHHCSWGTKKSARRSVLVGISTSLFPITEFDTQNAKTCMHMCLLWNWFSAKHYKSLDLERIQSLPQCAEW